MKPADVRRQITLGDTHPLYLLEQGDPLARQELAAEFAELVDEGLRAFNVESFHGTDASNAPARDQLIGSILVAARTLPMMAPRRVVVVHDAEALLSPKRAREGEDEAAPATAREGKRKGAPITPIDELEAYIQSPERSTTLVFAAGALDGNRRLVKLARKHAQVVDCGHLEGAVEAGRWVRQRLMQNQLDIEPEALNRLVNSGSLDLGRLRADVDRLALYAGGQRTLTVDDVKLLVAREDEPSEGPAVGFAIRAGNVRVALHELTALLDKGVPHLPVFGQIRWAAGGLPAHLVTPALDLVLETDLALKTSGGEPRFLLEHLVVRLCELGKGARR